MGAKYNREHLNEHTYYNKDNCGLCQKRLYKNWPGEERIVKRYLFILHG